DAEKLEDQSKFDTFAGEHKQPSVVLRRWMSYLDGRRKNADPIFVPWFELAALPESEFATNARPLLVKFTANSTNVNPVVAKALTNPPTASLKQVADYYTKLFKEVDAEWKAALAAAAKEK